VIGSQELSDLAKTDSSPFSPLARLRTARNDRLK
jgi:hypothetical protein